jgi:hypothetical protein
VALCSGPVAGTGTGAGAVEEEEEEEERKSIAAGARFGD